MATTSLPSVLAVLGGSPPSGEPDADLLARYVADRDEVAFAGLVRRYARLVWRVARTCCRSDATAEDVFQAAFMVLARKAGSIRSGGTLPGWLHRATHRIAARATRSERPVAPLTTGQPVSADPLATLSARELLAAVDDEVARLADAERSVLVLCGIDNLPLDEAATRLGWTRNSARGRLERARAKLRARLDARGLTLPAVALALLGGPPAQAVQAAMAAPGGAAPLAIEHLVSEGPRMTRRFITMGLAVVLVAGGFGTGVGLVPRDGTPVASAAPVPRDKPKAVVWSVPVRVDWKSSGVSRVTGVWLPDGKGVLVPAPTLRAKDEPLGHGGIDCRDAETGRVTKTLTYPAGKAELSFQPTAVAASADGKAVFANGSVFAPGGKGEPARGIAVWQDDDATEVVRDAGPLDAMLALSADGKLLATLAPNGGLESRDAATGKVVWASQVGGKKGKLTSVVYHPTERSFLLGTDAGDWITTHEGTGRTMALVNRLGVNARAAVVSGDGGSYAFGGEALDDGQPLVIHCRETLNLADAVPKKESIHGLAFSPDGKHLAAACSGGFVRVFEVKEGTLVASAKEHVEAVYSVAYSPDGTKLLSVGKDAVKVWAVEALMKAK